MVTRARRLRSEAASKRTRQITLVIEALEGGARTSREIASITDVPLKNVSAYLSELEKMGLAKCLSRGKIRFEKASGRKYNEWTFVG